MLDFGFSELVVVGVVALTVLGPERLPVVARKLGYWVGRARRFVDAAKQEVDRELRLKDVRDAIERNASLDDIKRMIDSDRYRIEDEITKTKDAIKINNESPSAASPAELTPQDENLQYGHTEHIIDPMDALQPPVQHENVPSVAQPANSAVPQDSAAPLTPNMDDHGKHSGG